MVCGAFHSGQETATPTKAGYIRADQFVTLIFRLQYGGGPYIPVCLLSGVSGSETVGDQAHTGTLTVDTSGDHVDESRRAVFQGS